MTDAAPSWRELAEAGHTGDERTARSALDHADPVRRELALGALARMGALDDHSLIALFEDAHPAVRRRAATIAATRPQLDLLGLLADPDDSVVEVAAWAAGEHERRDDDCDGLSGDRQPAQPHERIDAQPACAPSELEIRDIRHDGPDYTPISSSGINSTAKRALMGAARFLSGACAFGAIGAL